jgi:hypothetical protein
MNGEVEQGIERFGGLLEWRPRPTPGCSAIEDYYYYYYYYSVASLSKMRMRLPSCFPLSNTAMH